MIIQINQNAVNSIKCALVNTTEDLYNSLCYQIECNIEELEEESNTLYNTLWLANNIDSIKELCTVNQYIKTIKYINAVGNRYIDICNPLILCSEIIKDCTNSSLSITIEDVIIECNLTLNIQ